MANRTYILRATRDIQQLRASGFKVTDEHGNEEFDNVLCFVVRMKAPKDSAYEGYEYGVRFTIPDKFPFKSPSVGFMQRIYHPNVDEMSGSICLDSLNKAWSPAFTILNIVEAQLPYLLQYPNPADPFNREAAARMSNNPEDFKRYVKEHCSKYGIKQQ
jgi:ubiquitin-conjugating enzyme E2 H